MVAAAVVVVKHAFQAGAREWKYYQYRSPSRIMLMNLFSFSFLNQEVFLVSPIKSPHTRQQETLPKRAWFVVLMAIGGLPERMID
jgi:hypothetical protein